MNRRERRAGRRTRQRTLEGRRWRLALELTAILLVLIVAGLTAAGDGFDRAFRSVAP